MIVDLGAPLIDFGGNTPANDSSIADGFDVELVSSDDDGHYSFVDFDGDLAG